MKKVLGLLLACLMSLGASLAMAADSRTDGLGLTAGQQIDDVDGIFMFPQDAARFGNVADFRIGSVGNNQSWSDNSMGLISKDWDDVGYIGIYTHMPFNERKSNGNFDSRPNRDWANEWGILNGNNTWADSLNPANSAWNSASLTDTNGRITANYANIAFNVPQIPQDPQNWVDLFWAKDFADATIGVHVNYAGQDNLNDTGTHTYTTAPGAGTSTAITQDFGTDVMGLDLGLGLKGVGMFDSLDIAVGYSMGDANLGTVDNRENPALTGTNPIFNISLKGDGISEVRANILAKTKINDTTTGRIYLDGTLDSLGMKQSYLHDTNNNGNYTDAGETIDASKKYTNTNVNLGFACDHNVADGKAHVIGSLGLIYDARKWTQSGATNLAGSATADQLEAGSGNIEEETWWDVPVNVAVEAPLFSWLKVRVGGETDLVQSVTSKVTALSNLNGAGTAFQDNTVVTQTVLAKTNIRMLMGVGATFENFTLDMEVSEAAVENYLGAFQPGSGIFYDNGETAVFTNADVKYAF